MSSPLDQFLIVQLTDLTYSLSCYWWVLLSVITLNEFIPFLDISQFFINININRLPDSLLIFMILTTALVYLLNYSTYLFSNILLVTFVNNIAVKTNKFINSLIYENVGSKFVNSLFMPICAIFVFLLVNNITGMLPGSFTVTSSLVMTFTTSLIFFTAITISGFTLHGFRFLQIFIPSGSPIYLIPLLIIIEFISYIARVFSLSIRLFANMMAGHTLMKILATFAWHIFNLSIFLWLGDSLLFSIIFIITGLESVIAFLQAYVFVMLLSLYYNDVIHLH